MAEEENGRVVLICVIGHPTGKRAAICDFIRENVYDRSYTVAITICPPRVVVVVVVFFVPQSLFDPRVAIVL